ncbi:MAG: peptidyl-prolyl cis-trans isomerase [Nitrospinota bacterium]
MATILTFALSFLAPPAWGQTEEPKAPSPDQVVVARVDGRPLTLAQFNRLIDRFPPQLRLRARLQKEAVLKNLVNRELLYRLALKENLEKSDEVQRRLAEIKRGLLIQEAYRARVITPSEVATPEAQAHYEKNKAKYRTPERVTASHIMVKTEAEATALLKEITAGKEFDALAREKSQAPERLQGGSLGTFARGHHLRTGLPKEIEDTAFELKDGEVSKVVRSAYGWHVVKTFKHEAPQQRPFDEVREAIISQLRESKRGKLLGELLEKLRAKAKIELFPDRVP